MEVGHEGHVSGLLIRSQTDPAGHGRGQRGEPGSAPPAAREPALLQAQGSPRRRGGAPGRGGCLEAQLVRPVRAAPRTEAPRSRTPGRGRGAAAGRRCLSRARGAPGPLRLSRPRPRLAGPIVIGSEATWQKPGQLEPGVAHAVSVSPEPRAPEAGGGVARGPVQDSSWAGAAEGPSFAASRRQRRWGLPPAARGQPGGRGRTQSRGRRRVGGRGRPGVLLPRGGPLRPGHRP